MQRSPVIENTYVARVHIIGSAIKMDKIRKNYLLSKCMSVRRKITLERKKILFSVAALSLEKMMVLDILDLKNIEIETGVIIYGFIRWIKRYRNSGFLPLLVRILKKNGGKEKKSEKERATKKYYFMYSYLYNDNNYRYYYGRWIFQNRG